MACCIKFAYDIGAGIVQIQLMGSGTYNTLEYYEFIAGGVTYFIWWNPSSPGNGQWFITRVLGSVSGIRGGTKEIAEVPCPPNGQDGDGTWIAPSLPFTAYFFSDCTFNCDLQERQEKKYDSILLPSTFEEQNRGNKDCCCEYNVLGNAGGESWKTDITSAWIKVSSLSDLIEFRLFKKDSSGTITQNILLTKTIFPNDNFAYYSTIEWSEILNTYGVGCYEFKIEYSIAGIVGSLDWGTYNLRQYSIDNALHTARVRVKYNGYQEIEQINFSGSDVQDTFRFFGFIGNRQPNTEIDNIIYGNREMKRVIRENLNTYEIITDPSEECITRPLIERFLLSENELYISDYNAFNHSYRYEDLAVIVEESPELEYFDFSRKAKLTCKVSDKFKNKRTYY
tara:strand:+ start:3645 stop:4832 length:1188 start_codon:yes stop_codon:yes gene_type:complete